MSCFLFFIYYYWLNWIAVFVIYWDRKWAIPDLPTQHLTISFAVCFFLLFFLLIIMFWKIRNAFYNQSTFNGYLWHMCSWSKCSKISNTLYHTSVTCILFCFLPLLSIILGGMANSSSKLKMISFEDLLVLQIIQSAHLKTRPPIHTVWLIPNILVLFDSVLPRFQQSFSQIPWCSDVAGSLIDFYSSASLKYHTPDMKKPTDLILTEAVLTSTHNLCFEQKHEKYQSFLSENFQFLEVKFSIYLNRRVFVML